MEKMCNHCKMSMDLSLRRLVFKKHEIMNVPIFTCFECAESEVAVWVKEELKRALLDLQQEGTKQKVFFEDYSEYAQLLLLVRDESEEEYIEEIVEERMNRLVDLLLLSISLNDIQWTNELEARLKQVMTPIGNQP